MPHLQFEVSRPLSPDERAALVEWTTERYAAVMDTGTDHVAVTIRELDDGALSLGRAPPGEPVGLLNADIRRGRTNEQRETLARSVVEYFDSELGVPADHCYVIFTEHAGEDFHLAEGPLASWSGDEADGGATTQ